MAMVADMAKFMEVAVAKIGPPRIGPHDDGEGALSVYFAGPPPVHVYANVVVDESSIIAFCCDKRDGSVRPHAFIATDVGIADAVNVVAKHLGTKP